MRPFHPFLLAAPLLLRPLPAQAPEKQAPKGGAPLTEAEVIERYRRYGKPRPVAPRGPFLPEERVFMDRFRAARGSVVHIDSLTVGLGTLDHQPEAVPVGSGTGFVWDDHGHVVTNQHVINLDALSHDIRQEAQELQVTLADGKVYKARVIGRSLAHDIAVLQVFAPLEDLRPLTLGRSSDLQVGQRVMAIGNPFGLDHTFTTGVISALKREVRTDAERTIHGAIQTDAAINPGNSGGPLLDTSGRLIGMATAITSPSGASSGIGFAIPVDTLNRVVPHLIAQGKVEHPAPAMGFADLPEYYATGLGVKRGVVVFNVEPGSPADRAGLRGLRHDAAGRPVGLGDIILAYNGRPVDNAAELYDLLELYPPGDTAEFDVERDGRRVRLTLDLRPKREI